MGYHKCNFDASFDLHTTDSLAGWIIRDHLGGAYFWGTISLGSAISPIEAEAKALLVAIQQAWSSGLDHVVFEGGDCKALINTIHGKQEDFTIES